MFSNLCPDFIFSKDEISKDLCELLPIWSNEWSSRWLFNANSILRRYMAGIFLPTKYFFICNSIWKCLSVCYTLYRIFTGLAITLCTNYYLIFFIINALWSNACTPKHNPILLNSVKAGVLDSKSSSVSIRQWLPMESGVLTGGKDNECSL